VTVANAANLVAALACPVCRGRLSSADEGVRCRACGAAYRATNGYLDFVAEPWGVTGLGQIFMADHLHVPLYEASSRPAFLRLMGTNWGDDLSEADEERYLRERLEGVDGPVLDLACGAGRWTRVIAEAVGEQHVVGLDLSLPMLEAMQKALPAVPVVRGSALALPFGDGTLGAVTCWNALQMLPRPDQVIAEVGRCLRSGGRFVVLTFRPAADPVYRYFQCRQEETFNVTAFSEEDIVQWLAQAGLEVRDLGGPGTFLLITATKVGRGVARPERGDVR
jgi:SAM-dependent methyltransferase